MGLPDHGIAAESVVQLDVGAFDLDGDPVTMSDNELDAIVTELERCPARRLPVVSRGVEVDRALVRRDRSSCRRIGRRQPAARRRHVLPDRPTSRPDGRRNHLHDHLNGLDAELATYEGPAFDEHAADLDTLASSDYLTCTSDNFRWLHQSLRSSRPAFTAEHRDLVDEYAAQLAPLGYEP